ncbi:MAG: alpha/beta hydrolase [Alphaproteobacteria bacterium]|nr:alpha/beta hydrolase [Alphaproteobacteria bacterium]
MTALDLDLDAYPPAEALARLCALGGEQRTGFAGGQIVWRIWGDGPPLILLHGGYGTWMHWVRAIQPLAQDFRLLVPDMPGFGESDAPLRPHSPDGIAAALAEGVTQILGTRARLSIAGFSFGGIISGHLAPALAGRIDGLVLVGAGGLGAKRGDMPDLIPRRPGMTAAEIAAAHRRNLEILMLSEPSLVDKLALHIQHRNTEQHRVKSRPFSMTDTLARVLREVDVPLKAIWGERDATAGAYLRQREDILRSIDPEVDFRVMPGVGHWVMYEAPGEFATLLRELLKSPH